MDNVHPRIGRQILVLGKTISFGDYKQRLRYSQQCLHFCACIIACQLRCAKVESTIKNEKNYIFAKFGHLIAIGVLLWSRFDLCKGILLHSNNWNMCMCSVYNKSFPCTSQISSHFM